MTEQIVNHLLVFASLLALLNVGSLAVWRALKVACKPVPGETRTRVTAMVYLVGGAGGAILLLAGIMFMVLCCALI